MLRRGQSAPAPDVGSQQHEHHRENEQGALPPRGLVVRVINRDEALDDGAGEEGSRCGGGLPCECGLPAGEVAQKALVAPGREFRYPVVLSARSGCHGGHFGDGGDDGEEAEEGPDVGPEEPCEPAVDEALGDADQEEFPG